MKAQKARQKLETLKKVNTHKARKKWRHVSQVKKVRHLRHVKKLEHVKHVKNEGT